MELVIRLREETLILPFKAFLTLPSPRGEGIGYLGPGWHLAALRACSCPRIKTLDRCKAVP